MHKISEVQLKDVNSFPERNRQFQAYVSDLGAGDALRVKKEANIVTLEIVEVGPDLDTDNAIKKFREIFDQAQ